MPVAAPTFWTLLEQSRLLTAEQIRQLAVDFASSQMASDPHDATPLADWLVSRNVISKYQSTILLAGRSGPFLYGDYSVYDRIEKRRLTGWFRAVHRPTGHPVTLQFLTGPVVRDPHLWAQAAHLALAATAIRSPQLQRFLEPVDVGAFKFLVSEDMRGGSLEDKLAKDRIAVSEVCRCVRLAAVGLAHLHQAGRIHGDVRPANLWLESSAAASPGNVKLLYEPHMIPGPLNLADADPAGQLSLMADYVAPELAQPGKYPDPLTDIYALGCTLYTLLAGQPPFPDGTPQQKFVRHASEPIRPLEQLGVPQPLAQLVAFLMAKNPAVRFQSAAIVADQLAPFVDPQSIQVPAPQMPVTLPAYEAWLRQRPVQVAAAPIAVAPASPAPVVAAPAASDVAVSAPKKSTLATGSAVAELYKKKRQRKQIQLAIGTAVALLLVIGGGIYTFNFLNRQPTVVDDVIADAGGDGQETPDGSGGSVAAAGDGSSGGIKKTSTGDGSSASVSGMEVVADDGKLLWAPPTRGPVIDFRLVPPEGQVFVIVRPADLLANSEGSKSLDALGPEFAAQRTAWEAASGVPLTQVERLIISLHNNGGQFPRTSFVVKTKEPIATDDLLDKWGQPQEQKEGSATWYAGSQWAYYVSTSELDKQTFLMAQPADVKEVATGGGAPPALLRDVERLRRSIDGDRHLTVLFYPPFLFNDDGRPLFAGPREKVRPALSWFLGDGLQAAQLSMHLDSRFYFELRLLGSLDKEKYALASEFRDRLQTVPSSLEDYVDRITPPAYWSKLARRYPLMVQALHGNMRVGVESDQAIINSYLEGPAAHGLVLGGELLMASSPGAAVAAVGPAPSAPAPKTIEEVLALKTSMSFGSQSLEFAMRDIADDVRANLLQGSAVEFDIKLIGKDMEKDGITRNQSINDFKQEDKTVAEVLTAMVMKANAPPQTDPSVGDQKLIWVVAPDPDKPSRQIVLITTRTAAERDKYPLPAPFQPKR